MDRETNTRSSFDRVDEYLAREKFIFVFIWFFFSAVLVSSYVFIPPLAAVLIFLIAIGIYFAEKVSSKLPRREVLLLVLAAASFSFGVLRYDIKDFHIIDPNLQSRVGEEAEIEGLVISEPEFKDSYTQFVVDAGMEKVLVKADLSLDVSYGDAVLAEGELEKPGLIDDGVGRPFDYSKYLAKDDIYFILSFADAKVLSSGGGNPLKRALLSIKRSFVGKIRDIFPEPHASLLAGLVVAGKDAMPKAIVDEFRRAGVVHIVVLSGYNIAIISEFMRKLFENLFLLGRVGARPSLAAGASILGIIFFVLMTGAQATVVRASIMVLAVIAAKLFGRSYSAPRALLAAAFLMTLENPKILVFDPSFQLSLLATLALIYAVPLIEKYFQRLTFIPQILSQSEDKWGVRTMIVTTVATQIVVLPYLIYSMGQVSLVSLPANILILLLIPATMLTGFLAAVSNFLLPASFSLLLAFPVYLLLSWILGVAHVLGNLSLSSIQMPPLPVWLPVISYAVMIILVLRLHNSLRMSAN